MARSLVNVFPGLPPENERGCRVVVISSWTTMGIEAGVGKLNELNEARWPGSRPTSGKDMCRTQGEDGASGPEWFYAVQFIHTDDLENNRMAATGDRYGFQRWVWTEDAEGGDGR